MSHTGNTQLVLTFTVDEDQVAEGDRIWSTHNDWMVEHYPNEGAHGLLGFNLAKAPERSNPVDPTSEPTGRTCYTLTELYKDPASLDEHWALSQATYSDFQAFVVWASKADVTALHNGTVMHSLW